MRYRAYEAMVILHRDCVLPLESVITNIIRFAIEYCHFSDS